MRTRKIRVAALLACMSLLVAGSLWRLRPESSGSPAPDGHAQQSVDAELRAALISKRPVFHAQVAASGRYSVETRVALTDETGPLVSSQDVTLRATLDVRLPEDPEARAAGWVVGHLRGVSAEGDADLRKRLGMTANVTDGAGADPTRFAFRVDSRGEVVERRFAKNARTGERNLVAAVTAAVQVVQPAETVAQAHDRWRTTEEGASTTQHAIYEDLGDGHVRKSWGRTQAQAESQTDTDGDDAKRDSAMDEGAVSRGQARLHFDHGRLIRAVIAQRVVVDLAMHELARQRQEVRANTTVVLKGPAPTVPGESTSVGGMPKEAAFEQVGRRAKRAATGRGVADVLGASGRAHKARNWHARRNAAGELAANLAADPKVVDDVRAVLWGGKAKADALRTAVEGLGTAGNPASTALLTELIRDKRAPTNARWHGIALMVTLHGIDSTVVDALIAVSQDERDPVYKTASAALAAVVHRARKKAPMAEQRAYNYLLARAESCFALDHGDIRPTGATESISQNPTLWVMALGNLGGAEIYPLIAPYLVDKRRWLRRHAIEALRFVPTNEARLAMIKAMQRDPSPYNRRLAAEKALYHPQYLMEEHVLRALREDRHPEVQLGAAWATAVWGVTTPGLYVEIRHAAERAVNEQLKKTLLQLAQPLVYTKEVKTALKAAEEAKALAKKEQP